MASAHSPPRGDDDFSFSSSTDDEFSVGNSSNHTVDDGKSSTSSLSDIILETPVFSSSSRSSTNADVLNKPCEEDIESWNAASRSLWMEERPLRELQSIAINMSVDSDICDKKLGFFARTGYGKTHFVRTLGTVLPGGVIVIIVPLLSLSADQMKKMIGASQEYGSVETHHMDENSNRRLEEELIPRIKGLKEGTNSTIFLFVSPQYLVGNPSFVDALIYAHKNKVLQGIGIDEAHLYVAHSWFRMEIRALYDVLWLPIFSPNNSSNPPPNYWITTATITPIFIAEMEKLTGIPLPERSILWPDEDHFMCRHIDLQISISGDMKQHYDTLLSMLETTSTSRVVVFVTSVKDCDKLRKKVEKLLNNKSWNNINVITIHGQQSATEKFWWIRLFGEPLDPDNAFNPRVAILTGAANTGIDITNLCYILRKGFPQDLMTLFQERGRLAREEGSTGIYSEDGIDLDTFGKGSMISLRRQQSVEENEGGDDEEDDDPLLEDGDDDDEEEDEPNPQPCIDLTKYEPKRDELKRWKKLQSRQALDVLKFCCLNGSCKQKQAAAFLSTGILQTHLDSSGSDTCKTMCPACRKNKGKQYPFRTIYVDNLIKWFESEKVQSAMPLEVTYDNNGDSLTNLLWSDPTSIEEIFNAKKGSLGKYNVEALFLQLIAAEIISIKVRSNGSMQWVFNREKKVVVDDVDDKEMGDIDNAGDNIAIEVENVHSYKIDKYWVGVNIHPLGTKRKVRKNHAKKCTAKNNDK